MVTHCNTNWPVKSLSTADRTGSPIFSCLWSYVVEMYLEGFHESVESCRTIDTLTLEYQQF